MRRLHLFELEDQPWLPRVIRDFITDHLRYTLNEEMRLPINRAMVQRLVDLLEASGTERIVDLCSGAGGPVPTISRILNDELKLPVEIVLTDLYPNIEAFAQLEEQSGGRVRGWRDPISAADVPANLTGVRTLFTALHHFKPEQVRLVLGDAVRKKAPIAVFEPLERTWRMATLVAVMSLLRGFTHTPWVGQMSVARFLVTYLVPVGPAALAWDGLVSAWRSYTAEELEALATESSGSDYKWIAGKFNVDGPYGPMPTTYLAGVPVNAESDYANANASGTEPEASTI